MDRTFQKFLRSGLDLAPLGVERREENLPYFCTPKGAAIFGWAGVDGIHYCFIRGFGGMVFAVSPMNAAPDCVHPLARDFADFLRLLLACGDAAALEQAWMWGEAQFDAFLRENPPTAEQEACLAAVAAQLGLTPMEHPWAYLRELQASFDPGSIKYTEEYYNVTGCPAAEPAEPDWKVFFGGGFWGGRGNDRRGAQRGDGGGKLIGDGLVGVFAPEVDQNQLSGRNAACFYDFCYGFARHTHTSSVSAIPSCSHRNVKSDLINIKINNQDPLRDK